MTNIEHEVIQILFKLEDEDLYGLAVTVSQGFLKKKISSREEAIAAIIKYTPNLADILNRRVITKQMLMEYAHEKGIEFKIPVESKEIVRLIESYWNLCQVLEPEVNIREPAEPQGQSSDSDENIR